MTVHREAIDFYADDELAIMREERINRLHAAKRQGLGRQVRADLQADVSLIDRALKTRAADVRRLRRLAADEAEHCPHALRDLEMEAA